MFSVFSIFFVTSIGENQETSKKIYQKCDACAEMFFFLLMKLIGFLLLFTLSLRSNLFSAVTTETAQYFLINNDENQILLFYPRHEYKQSCNNKSDLRFPDISEEEGRFVPPKYLKT